MGLFNMIMGNATTLNPEEIQKEFSEILIDGEKIDSAFKVIRDKWVFTNLRLIILDVQGVTGSKRSYHSLPYSNITQFSIETAGTIDDDCELLVWVKGTSQPYKKEFSRGTNIKEIQRMLAKHVLK